MLLCGISGDGALDDGWLNGLKRFTVRRGYTSLVKQAAFNYPLNTIQTIRMNFNRKLICAPGRVSGRNSVFLRSSRYETQSRRTDFVFMNLLLFVCAAQSAVPFVLTVVLLFVSSPVLFTPRTSAP